MLPDGSEVLLAMSRAFGETEDLETPGPLAEMDIVAKTRDARKYRSFKGNEAFDRCKTSLYRPG